MGLMSRTLVVVGLLLMLAVPQTSGALATDVAACPVEGQVMPGLDGWDRIAAPAFPDDAQDIASYAVDPIDPDRMFVSNGRTLMRSVDGGCRWTQVYQIPELASPDFPFSAPDTVLEAVVVPASATAHDRVYLLLGEVLAEGVSRTHVVRSTDAGATWATADVGLLPYGQPRKLLVAESAPDTVYLVTSADAVGTSVLYHSADAGASWEVVLPPVEDNPPIPPASSLPPAFNDVAVGSEPGTLWATVVDGVWRSPDGGRRWQRMIETSDRVGVLDVFHRPGTSAVESVWAFAPLWSRRSDDGGTTWRIVGNPGGPSEVESIARGRSRDQAVAAVVSPGQSWVYGFVPATGDWVLLKHESAELRSLSADRASPQSFYARSAKHLWRYTPTSWDTDQGFDPPDPDSIGRPPPPPAPSPDPCMPDTSVDVPHTEDPPPPTLSPTPAQVALSPGETRKIPYRLSMPAAGSPVDLVFLVDTTNSMDAAICGVRGNAAMIARRLVEAGRDVHFGVADYKDYPIPPFGEPGRAYPYRRVLDVSPFSVELLEALRMLSASGGLDDTPESQLAALYQTATGDGQAPWIPAGQQMNFRPGSLRLVVNMTDAPFHDEPGYPGPSWEETVAALKAKGIRQAGIAFFSSALPDLRRMASESEALAVSSVDCGDGHPELAPGDPLVCWFGPGWAGRGSPIADAVSGMVLALRDEAPVQLVETTDSGVVAAIAPDVHDSVDLRVDNTLPFEVTYTCTPDQEGQIVPVELAARVQGETVATATASVVCGEVPESEVPPVPPVLPAPAVNAAGPVVPPNPPPPPPPPVPVAGPGPAPGPGPGVAPAPGPAPGQAPAAQSQPQSQPQGQSQMQMQAAVAVQEQSQPQTALAQADAAVKEQEGYSIAQQRRRYQVEPLHMLGAGSLLIMGLACVRLARSGAQWATARSRRSTRRAAVAECRRYVGQ